MYMGIQEVKKKLLHRRRRHGKRAEAHLGGKNVWVLTLAPLQQQLKPVKTGRRRQGRREEEKEERDEDEEAVTPKGEGCKIPAAEVEACPPAPKKPRSTAVLIRDSCRCDCDGEAIEFFRVPVDLEAVFPSRSAANKAN